MRNCFFSSTTWRSKKRMTAALRTLFSQLHAFLTTLCSCASLALTFSRCHTSCIASVAACSHSSVWASPLQPRAGLFCSCSGVTNSAVRITAAGEKTLSPVVFTRRCLPSAVEATSCPSWGPGIRRLWFTGGLGEVLNRRSRAKMAH